MDQRPDDLCVRAGSPRGQRPTRWPLAEPRRRRARRRCSTTTSTAAGRRGRPSTEEPRTPTSAATGTPSCLMAAATAARSRCRRRPKRCWTRRPGVPAGAVLGHGGRTLCRADPAGTGRRSSPYRGADGNMHTVEAYLIAGRRHRRRGAGTQRAEAICRADHRHPRPGAQMAHPRALRPRLDTHSDVQPRAPADPFRPFGATPGHAIRVGQAPRCSWPRPRTRRGPGAGGHRGVVHPRSRRRRITTTPRPGLQDRLAR